MVDGFPKAVDYFRVAGGQFIFFLRVIFKVVEPNGKCVPDVEVFVLSGILTVMAHEKFPIAFDAPEVLQGVVGAAHGDVVYRVTDAKDTFTGLASFGVEQVDSGEVGGRIYIDCGGDGGEQVDGMRQVWDTGRLRMAWP